MGHFTQLNDDDAELLAGGKKPANASTAYDGSNYGQYTKFTDPASQGNPSTL
ncbi:MULTISPECIES: hypothetical protein [unclassified Synechococcus]|uniref:hypothetical protein n=1 Tax=Synechococcales TaxID=1890424 RepID=UPI001624B481|nr:MULTISPECIES: hypothetical protein [unclassified Synechococcus]